MFDPVVRVHLILEGPGDRDAVPYLIRRIAEHNGINNLVVRPNPILRQNIPKLNRLGELERFLEYATSEDVDKVVVALDSDDACPVTVATDYGQRVGAARLTKPVQFAFFDDEFESLFLHCLDKVVAAYPEYGWKIEGWTPGAHNESCGGVKERLSACMKSGKAYKETRDQAKFVSALDLQRLRDHSRCFRHLEGVIVSLVA